MSFLTHKEAKQYLQSLNICSYKGFYKWIKHHGQPKGIPYHPERTYKNAGWRGWGDFLGTGNLPSHGRQYMPYEQCQNKAINHGINTQKEWWRWHTAHNTDPRVPYHPERAYRTCGWSGWNDFFGTDGSISWAERVIYAFLHANGLKFEHQAKLAGCVYKSSLWFDFVVWPNSPQPCAIEFHGDQHYRPVSHWGGQCTYDSIVIRDKIKVEYCLANSIPLLVLNDASLEGILNNLQIFLGTFMNTDWALPSPEDVQSVRYSRSFNDVRNFVSSLKFPNQVSFFQWCVSGLKPAWIPTCPHKVYKGNGWVSWGDFLGTGFVASQLRRQVFLGYSDAKEWASQHVKSSTQWKQLNNTRPFNVPSAPDVVYKNTGWTTWRDFLSQQ